MFKRITIIMAIIFILASAAFAGEFPIIEDSTVIGQNHGYPSGTPEMTEPGNLDLVTEALFFSKNLEIPDGRTHIGYLAPMRLRYRPHERVTIEAGAQLGHNFGDDDRLDSTEPIFRLAYEPANDVYLLMGTLIRTHTIHDALYDDANAFLRNSEQGVQIRADREHFKGDIWLNWKERETASRPEKFDFGTTAQLRFGGIHLDGQLFWVHTGGQLNNPDDPVAHVVDHNINFLGGASYDAFLTDASLLKGFSLGGYYLYDKDIPDPDVSGEEKSTGSGVEGRADFRFSPSEKTAVNIFGSYFNGDGLLCREGDPLYRKDEYTQFGTNLLFGLPAGLRLEFAVAFQYFDESFEHTEQLHLAWGKAFTLLRGLK